MNKIAILISLLISINITFAQKPKVYNSTEEVHYLMHYGWIDGGTAQLIVSEKIIANDTLYNVKLNAKTTGFTDRLYKVNDIFESDFDPETHLPIKAIRNIKEGKYSFYNEVTFDHIHDSVYSQKSGAIKVSDNMKDILSGFYFFREEFAGKSFKKDTIIHIDTYFADEVFTLILRYKGKETIDTDLGDINCLKFSPVVEVGRVFETEDDMSIWFSDDLNLLPIRVQFELFIGSLKCDLVKHKGLRHPLNLE